LTYSKESSYTNNSSGSSSKIARIKAQKSEVAEQQAQEYLDKAPERKRVKIIITAITVGVIVLGFLFFNYSSQQSARVFLLNGTNNEITIKIDNENYTVKAQSYEPITIPEGNYTYTSSLDDFNKEIEFSNIRTTWERLGSKEFIALNPGARALVWIEEVMYVEDGYEITEADEAALTLDYLTGEVITYDKPIDYPFIELPDEVTLDSYSDTKVITLAALEFPTTMLDELYIRNYYGSNKELDEYLERLSPEIKAQALSTLILLSLADEKYDDIDKYSKEFNELIKDDYSTSSETIRKIINADKISLNDFKLIKMDPFVKSVFSSYIFYTGQGNEEYLDYSYDMAKDIEELSSLLEYLYLPE